MVVLDIKNIMPVLSIASFYKVVLILLGFLSAQLNVIIKNLQKKKKQAKCVYLYISKFIIKFMVSVELRYKYIIQCSNFLFDTWPIPF